MNLFSFPFYESLNKQSRFHQAGKAINFPLYSPRNRFLPFQITKPADGQLIDCIKVMNLDDDLVLKIEPADVNYKMFSDSSKDYIFYFGGIIDGMNLPCGEYYLVVGAFVSEVFTAADVDGFVLLEWKHVANVLPVIYQTGFVQRLYLDSPISEPAYPTKLEEEEDGYGNAIPTLTTVAKRFIIEAMLAPEFLVDALAGLVLHSSVKIGPYDEVKSIQIEPEWLVEGYFARVQIQFNESELIISRNCNVALGLLEVNQAGYIPKPWECGDDSDKTPYWQDTGEIRCIKIERETGWRGINPFCIKA